MTRTLRTFRQQLDFYLQELGQSFVTKIGLDDGIVLVRDRLPLSGKNPSHSTHCTIFICSYLWEVKGRVKKNVSQPPEGIIELLLCDDNFDFISFRCEYLTKKFLPAPAQDLAA